MTEDEAKTKWCPHARAIFATRGDDGKFNVLAGQAVFNRYTLESDGDHAIPGGAVCLGSGCMQWRADGFEPAERSTMASFGIAQEDWPTPGVAIEKSAFEKVQAAILAAQGEGWRAIDLVSFAGMSWNIGKGNLPRGFCGLAGKP